MDRNAREEHPAFLGTQRFRDSIANMRVQFLTGRHPKFLVRGRLDIFLASLVMRLSLLAVR